MAVQQDNEKKGLLVRVTRYFKDIKGELKKTVWPSKKQVKNNTAIVIGAVLVSAAVIGGFDMLLSWVVSLIFGL